MGGKSFTTFVRTSARSMTSLPSVFFVAIFPGNINQYVNHIDAFGLNTDTLRLIRLFFQPVLIFIALWSTNGWEYWKLWAKGKLKE